MSEIETRSSRRAFFLSGGAIVGAGVATAVGATALKSDSPPSTEEQLRQLQQQLDCVADREAIRQLHLAFIASMEKQAYDLAADLFDERAHLRLSGVSAAGKSDILRLFMDQYRDQNAAAIHSAYRQIASSQQQDAIALSEDRSKATATFHVDVELCTPLQGDCTAAQMARLQGHVADRRWERGRLDAKYVKIQGQWKMASLSYQAS
jgi:hypothetical protein